jgi:hypothetical protein
MTNDAAAMMVGFRLSPVYGRQLRKKKKKKGERSNSISHNVCKSINSYVISN